MQQRNIRNYSCDAPPVTLKSYERKMLAILCLRPRCRHDARRTCVLSLSCLRMIRQLMFSEWGTHRDGAHPHALQTMNNSAVSFAYVKQGLCSPVTPSPK